MKQDEMCGFPALKRVILRIFLEIKKKVVEKGRMAGSKGFKF